jgi:hypothetical protein
MQHISNYATYEIKATKFKPEHTGQLNFYLNLVDDFYKTPEDKPTIDLLLRKSRNKFEAEYALKGIEKPMGISEYELTKSIPENLNTIVGGNPARIIRKRFDDEIIAFLLDLKWWDWPIEKITANLKAITTCDLGALKKIHNDKLP